QTVHGAVTIHLPCAFRGPLTVRTRYGAVRFSDALTADLTTIGEADSTRRCFVGSLGEAGNELSAWAGDEISIETSSKKSKVAP
ncbi:hypothetical protein C8R44DRAFT_622965, partial [Mycena epipterygia]